MSTNNTPNLPNEGSTHPHTRSDAISSNTASLGSDNQQPRTGVTGDGISQSQAASGIPAQSTNYSDETNPLQSHHRPSLSVESEEGAQSLPGDQPVGRLGLAQNAPGELGERGENILGAIGYGGSTVERPKEDQGIGEKIAEFLGA